MRKVSVAIMFMVVLMASCTKETPVIPPLPPNQLPPTLGFEFVSVASTTRFIPFGATLPNQSVNLGYQIQLSDTTASILTVCPGIVSSITPDTSGGNFIVVKYNSNSIYSFQYGGVTRVAVHVNDSLSGGKILGKITGNGIVDFQLIKNNNEVLCPETFGSPGFNTAIQEAILKSNTFYPTDSITSSCAVQSLPK